MQNSSLESITADSRSATEVPEIQPPAHPDRRRVAACYHNADNASTDIAYTSAIVRLADPKPAKGSVLAAALLRVRERHHRSRPAASRHSVSGDVREATAPATAAFTQAFSAPPAPRQKPRSTGCWKKPVSRGEGTSTVGRPLTESDRRAFPRHEGACSVSVARTPVGTTAPPQEQSWLLHASQLKGRLLDISMNGIAISLPVSIEQGETILLRLSNPRLDRTLDTAAEVVRSEGDDQGCYRIVCRFHRRLTLEQVNCFGKSLFPSQLV